MIVQGKVFKFDNEIVERVAKLNIFSLLKYQSISKSFKLGAEVEKEEWRPRG